MFYLCWKQSWLSRIQMHLYGWHLICQWVYDIVYAIKNSWNGGASSISRPQLRITRNFNSLPQQMTLWNRINHWVFFQRVQSTLISSSDVCAGRRLAPQKWSLDVTFDKIFYGRSFLTDVPITAMFSCKAIMEFISELNVLRCDDSSRVN